MARIEYYEIVDIDKVQEMVDNGWQPWGGPTCNSYGSARQQVVVMYESDEGILS